MHGVDRGARAASPQSTADRLPAVALIFTVLAVSRCLPACCRCLAWCRFRGNRSDRFRRLRPYRTGRHDVPRLRRRRAPLDVTPVTGEAVAPK